VSHGLQAGQRYPYEVRAEVAGDGETRQQTKTAWLRAGETAELAFDFSAPESVTTSLTLNVPEDATVILGGNDTGRRGERRVFETSKLKPGQAWPDYAVQVSVVRNGRRISQDKTITLVGGESRELSFDFQDTRIAAR
jgi:uncharacterized protein (TIGR03000 family)